MAKIYWAGQSCFQISLSNSKDNSAEVVIDPYSDIGLKLPRLSADIVMVTHDHPDHNNIGAVNGSPFVIQGPGEYEIKEVFIRGIPSFHDDKEGKERGSNTIYIFESENMKFCHLGDLGQSQLSDEQMEKIDSVDVLMIPIGGVYTISANAAQKIISQIEPKIVIPMHYKIPGLKVELDELSKFLKIMGKNAIEPVDKLTLKFSLLPKEGAMEIIVMKP